MSLLCRKKFNKSDDVIQVQPHTYVRVLKILFTYGYVCPDLHCVMDILIFDGLCVWAMFVFVCTAITKSFTQCFFFVEDGVRQQRIR